MNGKVAKGLRKRFEVTKREASKQHPRGLFTWKPEKLETYTQAKKTWLAMPWPERKISWLREA